jgi:hypothetical protein
LPQRLMSLLVSSRPSFWQWFMMRDIVSTMLFFLAVFIPDIFFLEHIRERDTTIHHN